MNIKEAHIWAKKELRGAGVSEPESSVLVLLGEVFSGEKRNAKSEKCWTRAEIMGHPEKELNPFQVSKFKGFVRRRKKHESVWQIIGKVEFYGLKFHVNKNVLVPRPETELLVQQVIQQITNSKHQIPNKFQIQNTKFNILDVGTGSGTIAISLAGEIAKLQISSSKFQIVATDISGKALMVARKNAKLNKVADKIEFIKADLFPPIAKSKKLIAGKFDIIVSNLPYIPSEDMDTLAMDVHHYEPKLALDGGPGGLEIYERFLSRVGNYLKPEGMIFCEIGINQGEGFKRLVKKHLPSARVEILGDLAGIDRIAIIELSEK
jgi:release factor glutamine methyltransferase